MLNWLLGLVTGSLITATIDLLLLRRLFKNEH